MWGQPMMGGCGYGGGCGMGGGMPQMMGGGFGGGCGMAMGGCGGGGGGGAAGMYQSREEETLYNEVAIALQPHLHLEKEWDADKFRKKMIEYFNKAHKGVSFRPETWEKNVDDYCVKFYECYWRALGDRYSYVEKVDLSASMTAAIRYYYTPSQLPKVPDEEFSAKVIRANNYGFDIARWQSWGYQIVKQNVTGKQSQKKVSEAIEYAREECVSQVSAGAIMDNETFIQQFVEKTMAKLSAISGGDPTSTLPMQTAVKLWNALIQEGGGIPISLERQNGRPPSGWDEIDKAVRAAYSSPGMAASAAPMGGMGGGGGMGMMGYGGMGMMGYGMPGYSPY